MTATMVLSVALILLKRDRVGLVVGLLCFIFELAGLYVIPYASNSVYQEMVFAVISATVFCTLLITAVRLHWQQLAVSGMLLLVLFFAYVFKNVERVPYIAYYTLQYSPMVFHEIINAILIGTVEDEETQCILGGVYCYVILVSFT